jgi:hypothetical protein
MSTGFQSQRVLICWLLSQGERLTQKVYGSRRIWTTQKFGLAGREHGTINEVRAASFFKDDLKFLAAGLNAQQGELNGV